MFADVVIGRVDEEEEACTSKETALSTLEGCLGQLDNGRCARQHGLGNVMFVGM